MTFIKNLSNKNPEIDIMNITNIVNAHEKLFGAVSLSIFDLSIMQQDAHDAHVYSMNNTKYKINIIGIWKRGEYSNQKYHIIHISLIVDIRLYMLTGKLKFSNRKVAGGTIGSSI